MYTIAHRFVFYGILIDTLFSPISLILGHLGITMAWHFFKIPFFITFMGTVICFRRQDRLDGPSKFFILFALLAFVNGLINHRINNYFFSHMYYAAIAFFGYRYGLQYANVYSVDRFNIEKYNKYAFILLLVCIVYFVLYAIGFINYFGISSNIGYVSLLYFANSNYKAFMVFTIGTILTGKRTVLVSVLLSVMTSLHRFDVKKIILILVTILSLSILFYCMGLLNRIVNPVISLIDNPFNSISLYKLTSGRTFEIEYAIKLFTKPLDYIIGLGYGVYYSMPFGIEDFTGIYYQHYTHFSPFSLAMIYGWVFTIACYLWIFTLYQRNNQNKYRVILTYAIVSSFAGAGLLVDSKVWIILGYFSAMANTCD